jgi:hypothetical protein
MIKENPGRNKNLSILVLHHSDNGIRGPDEDRRSFSYYAHIPERRSGKSWGNGNGQHH